MGDPSDNASDLFRPQKHRTAHRRLEGTVSASQLDDVRRRGADASPLLSALGRLIMVWNNLDFGLKIRAGSLPGMSFQTTCQWSTSQFIRELRRMPVPSNLEPAWQHMLTYYEQLRLYRNHFTHGVDGTFVSTERAVMEAYVIKTYGGPDFQEIVETIYKEDLDELTGHLYEFGNFAGNVIDKVLGRDIDISVFPTLPPTFRRELRDSNDDGTTN